MKERTKENLEEKKEGIKGITRKGKEEMKHRKCLFIRTQHGLFKETCLFQERSINFIHYTEFKSEAKGS